MKKLFAFLLLGPIIGTYAQTDTLYANQTHNLALFFPSPIRQAVTGSENFTFSYDRERAKPFGLLQASPGTKSNLLVITSDGSAYSFLLEFQEQLQALNRFVAADESIGNEKGSLESVSDTIFRAKPMFPLDNSVLKYRDEYFKKFSSYHTKQSHQPLASKRKKGLIVRLLNMVYNRQEVYAILEIENRSDIDFEVDYMKIFKANGNKRRKSSYQKTAIVPIYTYNAPEIVKLDESKRFALVFSKFTLGESERLLGELKEFNGSRIIRFQYSR